jgi:hypothetical protein
MSTPRVEHLCETASSSCVTALLLHQLDFILSATLAKLESVEGPRITYSRPTKECCCCCCCPTNHKSQGPTKRKIQEEVTKPRRYRVWTLLDDQAEVGQAQSAGATLRVPIGRWCPRSVTNGSVGILTLCLSLSGNFLKYY